MARTAKGTTLIAANTQIVGDVRFTGSLHVDGTVEGTISADNDRARLFVREGAVVRGEIRVANTVVEGRIDGDVHAHGQLTLAPTAEVSGDLYYSRVEVQPGAIVNGRMHPADPNAGRPLGSATVRGAAAAPSEDTEAGYSGSTTNS